MGKEYVLKQLRENHMRNTGLFSVWKARLEAQASESLRLQSRQFFLRFFSFFIY